MTLPEYRALVDERLDQLLPDGDLVLHKAMRYSALAGGKRLRPSMLLAAVDMLSGDRDEALDFACAVEMIHAYSLIHDDLPGMDDDCLRRGRPTNHMVFGVGQAVLAGDALLNFAFEVMLERALQAPGRERPCLLAISEIARGAGVSGMIRGQCLDLEAEGGIAAENYEVLLAEIHAGKTAAMFAGSLRAACRLAGAAEAELFALSEYAVAFGMLFQATDDILDVVGSAPEVGKTLGKDERSGKLTYASVYGVGGARDRALLLRDRAVGALEPFGARAKLFRELADSLIDRTR